MAPPRRQPSDDGRAGPKRAGRAAPRKAAARSDKPMPAKWGNVARRGARVVQRAPEPRDPTDRDERDRGRPPAWEPERWTSEPAQPAAPAKRAQPAAPAKRARPARPAKRAQPAGGGRPAQKAAPPAAAAPRPRSRKVPKVITQEVASAVEPAVAARVERRLAQAADAFERDHLPDALRILKPLAKEAPGVPAVRELTGLALYGTGQWAAAAKELDAFRALTSSVEQHPVLADCYRALKRYGTVRELWEELREASPSAALVTEGRIVAAGALADQGDVKGAIGLLERGPVRPAGRTQPHHARLWYALADLYERAGDAPRARDLFSRVVAVEPGLADAAERLAALG